MVAGEIGNDGYAEAVVFNLRKVKSQIKAFEEGDLTPEHVQEIAKRLGVPEQEVISMNRRFAGQDSSLNAPVQADAPASGRTGSWMKPTTRRPCLPNKRNSKQRRGIAS